MRLVRIATSDTEKPRAAEKRGFGGAAPNRHSSVTLIDLDGRYIVSYVSYIVSAMYPAPVQIQ